MGRSAESTETAISDEQGAQLSQECPPIHQQPGNGNKQPLGTMSIRCGRLFRLGWALQVVSAPAESFHAGGPGFGLVFSRIPSARGREHFGFDFRAAETEDFARVSHRLSILVSFIRRQQIDQVAKFVQ
jgi:hypothetical protein